MREIREKVGRDVEVLLRHNDVIWAHAGGVLQRTAGGMAPTLRSIIVPALGLASNTRERLAL